MGGEGDRGRVLSSQNGERYKKRRGKMKGMLTRSNVNRLSYFICPQF